MRYKYTRIIQNGKKENSFIVSDETLELDKIYSDGFNLYKIISKPVKHKFTRKNCPSDMSHNEYELYLKRKVKEEGYLYFYEPLDSFTKFELRTYYDWMSELSPLSEFGVNVKVGDELVYDIFDRGRYTGHIKDWIVTEDSLRYFSTLKESELAHHRFKYKNR